MDENILVSLKEGWEVYSSNCKQEYNAVKKKSPAYKNASVTARDIFLRNLPLIVVYKSSCNGPQAHLTKKLHGVQWDNFLNNLEWPSMDQLVKSEIVKNINSFIKPALSYATNERDRQNLKFILTKLTGAKYLSENVI